VHISRLEFLFGIKYSVRKRSLNNLKLSDILLYNALNRRYQAIRDELDGNIFRIQSVAFEREHRKSSIIFPRSPWPQTKGAHSAEAYFEAERARVTFFLRIFVFFPFQCFYMTCITLLRDLEGSNSYYPNSTSPLPPAYNTVG